MPKSERSRGRAVGEPGQQALLLLGAAALLDDRRRQHGREERARRHLAAELIEHDHQLRQSRPGPAVLLGQVDPEPTQIGHFAPIGGPGLLVGLEQGPGGLERLVGGEDPADRCGQLLVVVGDGDRHGTWPPWTECSRRTERYRPARTYGKANVALLHEVSRGLGSFVAPVGSWAHSAANTA